MQKASSTVPLCLADVHAVPYNNNINQAHEAQAGKQTAKGSIHMGLWPTAVVHKDIHKAGLRAGQCESQCLTLLPLSS